MELRAYARERALHCSEFNVTKYWSHVGDRADLKGGEQECGDHHHDGQQLFADDARRPTRGVVDCSGNNNHSASAFQLQGGPQNDAGVPPGVGVLQPGEARNSSGPYSMVAAQAPTQWVPTVQYKLYTV